MKKRRHLYEDIAFIVVSVIVAIILVNTGVVEDFVSSFQGMQWLGIFIAGLFFTSAFTTAPSIVLLGAFASTTPTPILVVIGGIGAMIGDYIIFRFVKDRIALDVEYLRSHTKRLRIFNIFKTHLFKSLVPFIGALIIASPFPDEIGVAMLGLSRVDNRVFILVSLLFNMLGIYLIAVLASTLL